MLQLDECQLAEAVAPYTVQWLCQQQLKEPLEVGWCGCCCLKAHRLCSSTQWHLWHPNRWCVCVFETI